MGKVKKIIKTDITELHQIFNRDIRSQKSLKRGLADTKRTQMPAQPTIPNKTINQYKWRNQNIPGQNQM
jgi:hypothetical protein